MAGIVALMVRSHLSSPPPAPQHIDAPLTALNQRLPQWRQHGSRCETLLLSGGQRLQLGNSE